MEKKCIVWSPNSWQTGFRERISERRGVFASLFSLIISLSWVILCYGGLTHEKKL